MAAINNMGTSHFYSCNSLVFTIWEWCIERQIWLSAAHIPGKENTAADSESRKVNLDAVWKLNRVTLRQAFTQLQIQPSVDLFASRLNTQLPLCVSYRPDQQHTLWTFSPSVGRTLYFMLFLISVSLPECFKKYDRRGAQV